MSSDLDRLFPFLDYQFFEAVANSGGHDLFFDEAKSVGHGKSVAELNEGGVFITHGVAQIPADELHIFFGSIALAKIALQIGHREGVGHADASSIRITEAGQITISICDMGQISCAKSPAYVMEASHGEGSIGIKIGASDRNMAGGFGRV